MGCGKKRYKDHIAAKLALSAIQHRDNIKRPATEGRTYYCARCRAYHLTSKEKK